MDEATCTKQCCVRAEVVVMAWAMMRKLSLVASRHLGLDVARFAGIFVGGEGKLEYVVPDLSWDFEERRGGLGVCGNCYF